MVRDFAEQLSGMMGRHHAEHNLCVAQCSMEVACNFHCCWNGAAGQKKVVGATIHDRAANLVFIGPKTNLMSSLATENYRKSRSPRARSNDGDAAHGLALRMTKLRPIS